jgi:hypothetical protein
LFSSFFDIFILYIFLWCFSEHCIPSTLFFPIPCGWKGGSLKKRRYGVFRKFLGNQEKVRIHALALLFSF